MIRTLLTLLLLAGGQVALAQPAIRVGAWNIETLGSPLERDYPQRRAESGWGVARDPVAIAAQIERMRVDVLALEEIDDTDQDPAVRSNSILDRAIAKLNEKPGNRWQYRLFVKRRRDQDRQYTGLAWNEARVQAVGRPLRIAVSDVTDRQYAEWDRQPHAMKFSRGSGRTDFVVVPIHMKAGSSQDDLDQREQEARSLLAEFSEIRDHFGDEDLILIGDFNMKSRDEQAGLVFRNDGGMFDLNYGDLGTHVTGWALDRCYIPRSQRPQEFQGVTRIEILAPADTAARQLFRRDLSDHWPIVLQFSELADDD